MINSKILDWEDYFINLSEHIANRSTCLRKQVGCIITRENYILATGYNGALPKHPECIDLGCLRDTLQIPSGQAKHICRAMHAEQNAVAAAAKNGISLNGATCYVTLFPCINCAKTLIMAGIEKVVVKELGKNQEAFDLFTRSNVEISILETED